MVGGCCVCADENGWTDNPLIYCDGENCEVAVHQGEFFYRFELWKCFKNSKKLIFFNKNALQDATEFKKYPKVNGSVRNARKRLL